MGSEAAESNLSASVEVKNEEKATTENGKVNIKFGSHGVDDDQAAKSEVHKAFEVKVPIDVMEEWPEPQRVQSLYIVKYRLLEDQKLKEKLDLADKELQNKNQTRFQITEKLKAIRADRAEVIAQLKALGVDNKQYRMILGEKRKELEPLQHALSKLRGGNGGGRDRGSFICSSEEELDNIIKSFQYRIQHESIPLNEEKQILREIKQLEATRPKVIANAAERAKIQESFGEKEVIQDHVKLIGVDLDGVRKEQQVVKAKLKQLEEEKESLEKQIDALQKELAVVAEKRDNTYSNIQEMRKQRGENNSSFYDNRTLLRKARELAENKDVEALKQLSETEVDKFVSLWSSNKAFREDYERRILPSLDARQLSRDGRIRNPNEKPLVSLDVPTPSQPEPVVEQPSKETKVSPAEQKFEKEKNFTQTKEANKKTEETAGRIDVEDTEEGVVGLEKLEKDSSMVRGLDEIKLMEISREEELPKQKMAMERKKKQAEKAAAKAAIKAQKEAEKKLKERETRVKKKAGAAIAAPEDSEEPNEATLDETVAERERVDEKVETPVQVQRKNKGKKENILRHKTRPKGPVSNPKVIPKRKRTSNYWVWAASAAALVVLTLLVLGYNYLPKKMLK